MTTRHEKCTLYAQGEFFGNYFAYKCVWVTVDIEPYAQYKNAVRICFLEKGKRKPRSFVQTYKPSLVIAEGWNTPQPPPLFEPPVRVGAVTTSSAKYSAASPGWQADFEAEIRPNSTVLASYAGFVTA